MNTRDTGRARPRQPDSEKRAPAQGWVPRSAKRASGRREAPLVPAHIRVLGVELDQDDRTYIGRKLGMKLGKFATSIERISVRVDDVNGPRGGVDQVCRINVVLIGLAPVVFQQRDVSLEAAIDGALTGTERAVRRSVQRRRMKPIRGIGRLSSRPVTAPRARCRVAINGLGRIGRAVLKVVIDEPALELIAVNDLVDAENLAYLLRFDTVYGRYSKPVAIEAGNLAVAGRRLRTLRSRDPLELPWKELGVDLVFECTGALARREDLEKHVRAGARFVLLSAPSKDGEVETTVHGANLPGGIPAIVSCASCTTNSITPIVEVIGRRIGFKKAVMTTVHAYTSSQSIVDDPSNGFRRGRAAAANLVPTTSGAALATTRALPEYAGLFDGIAIRAPIPAGSIADLTFLTSRKTSVDEVNQVLAEEAETKRYAGVLGVSRDPLVSSDIVGDPRASVVDMELTRVVDGDLVKVMSWYDNEWGYANQMVREALSVTGKR